MALTNYLSSANIANYVITTAVPKVADYVQEHAVTHKLFPVVPWPYGGDIEKRVTTDHNVQVGYTAADSQLPVKGKDAYDKYKVVKKYGYAQGAISGVAMIEGQGNKNFELTDLLARTFENLKKSVMKVENRIAFGDGTGRLGLVASKSGDTATLDGPFDLTRYFRKNQTCYGVYAANAGANNETLTVSSVDHSANTVTFTASVHADMADGDIIYPGLQNAGSSQNQEPNGLRGIVDDGTVQPTFQNITRSSNAWSKANLQGNSGTNRALTLKVLRKALKAAKYKSDEDGTRRSILVCEEAFLDEYYALAQVYQRYQGGDFNLGKRDEERATFDGKTEFYTDIDCPYYKGFIIHPDDFENFVLENWKLLDEDKGVLARDSGTDNRDQWWFTMRCIRNLACWNPTGQTLLDDITHELYGR